MSVERTISQLFDTKSLISERDKFTDELKTSQVLSSLLQRNVESPVSNPLQVQKIGQFLRWFAATDEARKLATTPEIRDFVVFVLAKFATTPASSREVAAAICNLCASNLEGQRLVTVPEAIDAVIEMTTKHASTAESVEMVAHAISNITASNAEAKSLFCQHPEIICLFADHLAVHATTPDSVIWVASAICEITFKNSDKTKERFATKKIAECIQRMAKFAITAASVQWVSAAICNIVAAVPGITSKLFFTTNEFVSLVNNSLVKYADTADSVTRLASTICDITHQNPEGVKLFMMTETIASIHTMAKHATTALAVRSVATVMCNLAHDNAEGKTMLSRGETASSIKSLALFAETADSVEWLASALCYLTHNNPDGKPHFFSSEIAKNVIIDMLAPRATTNTSVRHVAICICNVITSDPKNCKPMLSNAETVAAILSLAKHALSDEAVTFVASAICDLTFDNPFRTIFVTPLIVESLLTMANFVTSALTARWVATAICNATWDASVSIKLLISNEKGVSAMCCLAKASTTTESVRMVASAINYVMLDNDENARSFATRELIGEIKKMVPFATTEEGKIQVDKCLQSLTTFFEEEPEFD